jgi:hypothetical protein
MHRAVSLHRPLIDLDEEHHGGTATPYGLSRPATPDSDSDPEREPPVRHSEFEISLPQRTRVIAVDATPHADQKCRHKCVYAGGGSENFGSCVLFTAVVTLLMVRPSCAPVA